MYRILRIILSFFILVTLFDCEDAFGPSKTTPETQEVDFEQWKTENVRALGGGKYVIDDKTLVPDEKYIFGYYERFVGPGANSRATVALNTAVNAWSVWDNNIKNNITYCISNDFGSNKQRVINAILSAETAWESSCNVNFNYISSEDGHATAGNDNVVFDVRPATSLEESNFNLISLLWNGLPSFSFYPHFERFDRELVIFSSLLTNTDAELTALMKHEFGHILGLTDICNFIGTYPGDVASDNDANSIMCIFMTNTELSPNDCEGINKIYSYNEAGLTRNGPYGGGGGGPFWVIPPAGYRISNVTIYYGMYVNGIKVKYVHLYDSTKPAWERMGGSEGPGNNTLELAPDEYFINAAISTDCGSVFALTLEGTYVEGLTLMTNKHRTVHGGYDLWVDYSECRNIKWIFGPDIIGFFGRGGSWLDQIGFYSIIVPTPTPTPAPTIEPTPSPIPTDVPVCSNHYFDSWRMVTSCVRCRTCLKCGYVECDPSACH